MERRRPHNRMRGGQRGNKNACRYLPWPDVKLETGEDVMNFVRQHLIPAIWTGELGTRQAGALNNACRILIEFDPDIQELDKIRKIGDELEAYLPLIRKQTSVEP